MRMNDFQYNWDREKNNLINLTTINNNELIIKNGNGNGEMNTTDLNGNKSNYNSTEIELKTETENEQILQSISHQKIDSNCINSEINEINVPII